MCGPWSSLEIQRMFGRADSAVMASRMMPLKNPIQQHRMETRFRRAVERRRSARAFALPFEVRRWMFDVGCSPGFTEASFRFAHAYWNYEPTGQIRVAYATRICPIRF